jgi:hypothetical protein
LNLLIVLVHVIRVFVEEVDVDFSWEFKSLVVLLELLGFDIIVDSVNIKREDFRRLKNLDIDPGLGFLFVVEFELVDI